MEGSGMRKEEEEAASVTEKGKNLFMKNNISRDKNGVR